MNNKHHRFTFFLTCIFHAFFIVQAADIKSRLAHPDMDMRIGLPAVIQPGGAYPSIMILSQADENIRLLMRLTREDTGDVVREIGPIELQKGLEIPMAIEGVPEIGQYRIQLLGAKDQKLVYSQAFYFSVLDPKALPQGQSLVAHPGPDGRMIYIPDYLGNRIPDFSSVGYLRGGREIPQVPVRRHLQAEPGCNADRIQAAIDEVSALEPDEHGIRGAVLLEAGVYEIRRSLNIRTGGVVLRGEGAGEDKRTLWLEPEWMHPEENLGMEGLRQRLSKREATVLVYPGRATNGLLMAEGGELEAQETLSTRILDEYVPVGSFHFNVEDPGDLRVGDQIIVRRIGNEEWISEIKMDQIPGKNPWTGQNWDFERTITAVHGHRITVDSPLVNAIEREWGGGEVYRYNDAARIRNVGMENMRVMMFDQIRNGELSHLRGVAARFRNVRDGWIQGVVAEHCGDRVFTIQDSSHITIRDSSVLIAPRNYFSGYMPHYGFFFGPNSHHVLVRDCFALHNRHAYVFCAWVRGPNVVYNSVGEGSATWSEPHHRWSVGGLFDNVTDFRIAFMNRLRYGSGHGWAGANYVAWNTRGTLVNEQPPTAQNWAIGHVGEKREGPFHRWNLRHFDNSFGYWESLGTPVEPASLYLKQLEDRFGKQ